MKTLMTTTAVAFAIFTLAMSAKAEQDLDLAGCSAELKAYFGEDTQFSVVDRRRNAHGTRVRVAAKLDEDNAYFATCWVPNNDIAAYELGDASTMVAVTEPAPVER